MKEGQGYLGIDLEGLFAAIDKQVTTGGRVGDKFEGASIPSEDLSAAEQGVLENRRMGFLEDTFSRDKSVEDLAEMDIRKTAITFKEEFESWHDNVLFGASPQEDKELAEKTTIEDLANTAESEHERLARYLGRQVPNSIEHHAVSREAYRWEVISRIVRAASEIRD